MADPRQYENNGVRESGELILAPNEFAQVLDKTKGNITTYCGPAKTSLAQSDQPVVFDPDSKRFKNSTIERATQLYLTAPKGFYVTLKNPAKGGVSGQPKSGKSESLSDSTLEIGKKVNYAGPVSFPLWPGQIAKVVKGHHLRTNQYLVIRIYDEDEARTSWDAAVIKTAGTDDPTKVTAQISRHKNIDPSKFTTGQTLIIRGTEVSFFIPPTGIEVLEENGEYVKSAVTLERLEYTILLDEDGNKRYLKGPDVVFPEATEAFVSTSDNKRKFRAYELNDNTGIYIKVIADYTENGTDFHEGQELFITGKDQAIYYPRPEHAIIKYDDRDKHYAVALPAGEARYVLNRDTGEVDTVKGPSMLLPDPRSKVIIKRILSQKDVELYYPGNTEAKVHNSTLEAINTENGNSANYIDTNALTRSISGSTSSAYNSVLRSPSSSSAAPSFGDQLNRGSTYTPPRTLTLNTKYEGAVTVNPWTGYAIQVVDKSGNRRVVEGPATVILNYDEYLEKLTLSRGRPKNSDSIINTVYLRTINNRVGDIITVKTKDLITVQIELQYIVQFIGDKNRWFNIGNYVQYLAHHLRSVIGNTVASTEVADFYTNSTNILRETVLGEKISETDSSRVGRVFTENNMKIYELEIVGVKILDSEIYNLIESTNRSRLVGSAEKIKFETEKELFSIKSKREELVSNFELSSIDGRKNIKLAEENSTKEVQLVRISREKEYLDHTLNIKSLELDNKKLVDAHNQELEVAQLEREISKLLAEANAFKAKGEAISPELSASIQQLVQGNLLKNLGELAPLAIVQGTSLAGVLGGLLEGTQFADIISKLNRPTNYNRIAAE